MSAYPETPGYRYRRRSSSVPVAATAPPVQRERGGPVSAAEPEEYVWGQRGRCRGCGGVVGRGVYCAVPVVSVLIAVDGQSHLPVR